MIQDRDSDKSYGHPAFGCSRRVLLSQDVVIVVQELGEQWTECHPARWAGRQDDIEGSAGSEGATSVTEENTPCHGEIEFTILAK